MTKTKNRLLQRGDSDRGRGDDETRGESVPRQRTVFGSALVSLAMLWLAFPPAGIWWLAWLAPIPLIWLVLADRLPEKRTRISIGLAGLFYWLATFYFIPIPHPALWLGWFAVSLYMSVYPVLFVFIARAMVHRYRIPAVIACPVAWTGLEWFRCWFATGMPMFCLSHSQFRHPLLIQIADLSGAYTVTFAMVMFASGLAVATVPKSWVRRAGGRLPQSVGAVIASMLVLGAVIGYGHFRLNASIPDSERTIEVGLIQSSIDVVFRPTTEAEMTAHFNQLRQLTDRARHEWPELDVIVWPEGRFPVQDLLSDASETMTVDYFRSALAQIWLTLAGAREGERAVPMLVGATTHDPANQKMYNSALLISDSGNVVSRYFKIHRVMFGEYVPFADRFPKLQELTPIGRGLTAGSDFTSFEIDGIEIAPSICFESTVPHLIRRQINTLESIGKEPDVMVNLTDDGWFYGTSCLDMHLACNVFRAVEMRKPHLVCANTGFSAEIDTRGRLLQIGPRRNVGVLKATVGTSRLTSVYRKMGDLIPMLMGLLCGGVLVHRWVVARWSRS